MKSLYSQMKTITRIAVAILTITSCVTYKPLTSVQNRNDIPKGTQAIIVTGEIKKVKEAFKNKGIMLQSLEGGFKTDEILLDEGTRAMYKANEFDNQIKILAYWGITQKAKSQMIFWSGADVASAYDVNAWDQVIYRKNDKRPKMVFDYAVQILGENNINFSFR